MIAIIRLKRETASTTGTNPEMFESTLKSYAIICVSLAAKLWGTPTSPLFARRLIRSYSERCNVDLLPFVGMTELTFNEVTTSIGSYNPIDLAEKYEPANFN